MFEENKTTHARYWLVGLCADIIILALPVLRFVKSSDPLIQHLLHPWGYLYTGSCHLAQYFFYTKGIPAFKSAYLPAKTRFKGFINFIQFIRYLGYTVRNIRK